jgi:hypothetical protein
MAGRHLSRAAVMEASKKGKTPTDSSLLEAYNKISNELASLYMRSSVKGIEVETAMHYAGTTALNELGWTYSEGAAYTGRLINKGIAPATAGISIRDKASPEAIKSQSAATLFWELYRENAKKVGNVRAAFPEEMLKRGGLTFSKKNAPLARRLALIEEEKTRVYRSGDLEQQAAMDYQSAQEFRALKTHGIHHIKPHESQQPVIQDIAGYPTKEAYIKAIKEELAADKGKKPLEEARVEQERNKTQSGAWSILTNRVEYGIRKVGEAIGIGDLVGHSNKAGIEETHIGSIHKAMTEGNPAALKKALDDAHISIKAGTAREDYIMKGIRKQHGAMAGKSQALAGTNYFSTPATQSYDYLYSPEALLDTTWGNKDSKYYQGKNWRGSSHLPRPEAVPSFEEMHAKVPVFKLDEEQMKLLAPELSEARRQELQERYGMNTVPVEVKVVVDPSTGGATQSPTNSKIGMDHGGKVYRWGKQ